MTMNAPFPNKLSTSPLARTKTRQCGVCGASPEENKPSLLSIQLDEELFHHNYHKSMKVVNEEEKDSTTTYSTTYSIASSGSSYTSSSSVLSCSTDNSSSSQQEQPKVGRSKRHNHQRRKIFSQYWQTNPLPSPPMAGLVREPKSPLIQHYARTTNCSDCNTSNGDGGDKQSSSSPATSSESLSLSSKALSVSPARRSIFGACHQDDLQESEVEIYLSRHKHMTVLPASFDAHPTLFAPRSDAAAAQFGKRSRSYSCSDTFSMAPANGSNNSNDSNNNKTLTSCLRLHGKGHRSSPSLGRCVTFDSQVSIVSFEPTTSCNVECHSDGSWTDVFDH